jgi:hypothetical protein
MCDRWEDADDDIRPLGKRGRVARLGIAGFVACAVAGEQQQQQQQEQQQQYGGVVIIDSKRVRLSASNGFTKIMRRARSTEHTYLPLELATVIVTTWPVLACALCNEKQLSAEACCLL